MMRAPVEPALPKLAEDDEHEEAVDEVVHECHASRLAKIRSQRINPGVDLGWNIALHRQVETMTTCPSSREGS